MKTSSSELNEIIASLEPREVSGYLATSNKECASTVLFKLLVKNYHFSDQKLKEILSKRGFIVTNFSRIKNYLYDSVIDYLSTVENKSSVRYMVRKQIAALEILIDKNLVRQARKLLVKLKDAALRLGLEAQMIDLLNLEADIISQETYSLDYAFRSEVLVNEYNMTIERLGRYCELTDYYLETKGHLANLTLSKEINGGRIEYIARQLEHMTRLPIEGGNPNLHCVVVSHYLLGVIAYIMEDEKNYQANYLEALNIVKSNKKYILTYSRRYLLILANLGDVSIILRDHISISYVIDTIKQFRSESDIQSTFVQELIFGLVSRKMTMSVRSTEEMEFVAGNYSKFVLEKKRWIATIVCASSIVELIVINLLIGNTINTLNLISYYDSNPTVKRNNGQFLLFIELLACIDKDSSELVESRARSLTRRLEAENPLRKVVQHLAKTFRRLNSSEHFTEAKAMFVACPSQYIHPDPNFKPMIIRWFDAKLNYKIDVENDVREDKAAFHLLTDSFFRLSD